MMRKDENLKEILNVSVSLFWTAIFLGPVAWFCIEYLSIKLLLILLSVSLIAYFIKPFRIKHAMLHSKWVLMIGKLTQDGSFINKLMRKRYKGFRVIRGKKDLRNFRNKTRIREAFHFQMFLFLSFLFFYALYLQLWGWAAFMLLSNFLYNIWPLLFLQYQWERMKKIK